MCKYEESTGKMVYKNIYLLPFEFSIVVIVIFYDVLSCILSLNRSIVRHFRFLKGRNARIAHSEDMLQVEKPKMFVNDDSTAGVNICG
jgi:hypothetical protein